MCPGFNVMQNEINRLIDVDLMKHSVAQVLIQSKQITNFLIKRNLQRIAHALEPFVLNEFVCLESNIETLKLFYLSFSPNSSNFKARKI